MEQCVLLSGSNTLLNKLVTLVQVASADSFGGKIMIMAKVIKLCAQSASQSFHEAVDLACHLIQTGKVIALPTDTIYGIACSARNKESIQSLYQIKDRDQQKPLAICVADVDQIGEWCELTVSRDLLVDLLPGPVTLVFQRSSQLNPALNPDTGLVGVRIPNHEFVRVVARRCGPLALTSANLSGQKSSLSVDEFKPIWCDLAAVFDGGLLKEDSLRLGSTVVDLSSPAHYKVIRDGCALHRTVGVLEKTYSLLKSPET